MALTFTATNYRVLKELRWSPAGVCLLTGANGAGKTTTLSAFQFLAALFQRGHEAALGSQGGLNFRRLGAPPDEPVTFSLSVGDLTWILRFPMSAEGLKGAYGEELRRGDEVLLRAGMFQDEWFLGNQRLPRDEVRCCLRVLWDRGETPELAPLVSQVNNVRVHLSYWLNQAQRVEPVTGRDSFLHYTGRNLWSVLANWKAAPMRYSGQYDWVLQEARRAFPGLIGTLEFDRGIPYFFAPDAEDAAEGLLPDRMADGLLTGLMHLTAIAGASRGALLAFDEMENQLHPHAIRSILHAMRQRAEEKDLTIILSTHSPVLMNAFGDSPDDLFVLHRGPSVQPVSLTTLHSEDALAQVTIGDLYDQLDFAAPDLARWKR